MSFIKISLFEKLILNFLFWKNFLLQNVIICFFIIDFPSTRLELEAVADIFDLDKDGFIDYKEFLATLKPTAVKISL